MSNKKVFDDNEINKTERDNEHWIGLLEHAMRSLLRSDSVRTHINGLRSSDFDDAGCAPLRVVGRYSFFGRYWKALPNDRDWAQRASTYFCSRVDLSDKENLVFGWSKEGVKCLLYYNDDMNKIGIVTRGVENVKDAPARCVKRSIVVGWYKQFKAFLCR